MAVVAQRWTFGKLIVWQRLTRHIHVIWEVTTQSLHNSSVKEKIAVTIIRESVTKVSVTRMVAILILSVWAKNHFMVVVLSSLSTL
jgi:hypothetical protein